MLLSHRNTFTHKMLNLTKSPNQSRCWVFFIFLGLQNFCVAAQLSTIIVTIVARWQSSKSDLRKKRLVPFTRKEATMDEEFILRAPTKCKESSALVFVGDEQQSAFTVTLVNTHTHTHKWALLRQSLPGSSTAGTRRNLKTVHMLKFSSAAKTCLVASFIEMNHNNYGG